MPIDETSGRVAGPREPVTTGGGAALRAHPNVSRDGHRIAYVEQIIASDNIQKASFRSGCRPDRRRACCIG